MKYTVLHIMEVKHAMLLLQATAETVYDILSPTPPLTRCVTEGRPASRPRRTPQPADLREGVAKAYDTVREVAFYCTILYHPQLNKLYNTWVQSLQTYD